MNDQKALTLAIELLTRQIVDLPLRVVQTAQMTPEQLAAEQQTPETQQPGFAAAERDTFAFGTRERPRSEAGRAAETPRGFDGAPVDAEQPRTFDRATPAPAPAGGVGTDPSADGAFWGRLKERLGGVADAAGKGGAKLTEGIGNVGGMLIGKFAAVIGPLAVMSQVLQASTSGFATLNQATRLFAAVVAPFLLPATLLLAVAFVAASDVLLAEMLPALDELATFVFEQGIPALKEFTDALIEAAKVMFESFRLSNQGRDALLDALGLGREDAPGLVAATGDGGATAGGRAVDSALRDVMASFRRSMGPQAQISGLEGVGKAAQLAALNADPIEARMLRVQQEVLKVMERVANNTARRGGRVYDPPGSGDFSGAGEGRIGGDAGGDF